MRNRDPEPTIVGNALAGVPADRQAAGRPWQSPVPILLGLPAVLALLVLVLPLIGLLIKAPWGDAGTVLTSPGALQALRLSMITATFP